MLSSLLGTLALARVAVPAHAGSASPRPSGPTFSLPEPLSGRVPAPFPGPAAAGAEEGGPPGLHEQGVRPDPGPSGGHTSKAILEELRKLPVNMGEKHLYISAHLEKPLTVKAPPGSLQLAGSKKGPRRPSDLQCQGSLALS